MVTGKHDDQVGGAAGAVMMIVTISRMRTRMLPLRCRCCCASAADDDDRIIVITVEMVTWRSRT